MGGIFDGDTTTDFIDRKDLASLTEECAKITGIPYIMDAYREEAMAIINS